LDDVQLQAPIPVPRQLRDFHSDAEHMRRSYNLRRKIVARMAGEPEPPAIDPAEVEIPQIYLKQPVFYLANRYGVCGPEAGIPRPSDTEYFDYELELAAIIGKKGKDISEPAARDYIFGYTIMNDFKMISYVSQGESLYPGEVIGSGTFAGGCGLEIDCFLKEGDVVEFEFEKIGVLRNPIVSRIPQSQK
jgi:2-keto-4-pentenoate hydratase/2-oxohepta-3-ene-1,7-dioic acid hydratase in catechol pathway